MKHRNNIIIACLILSIILLGTGTFAYFRFGVTGNINVNTGQLMLSINDKSATQNEQFEVILTNEDGSNLKPGDSGSFDLVLNATGSSLDVSVVLEIVRTNLPTNLRFYVDEEHTEVFTSKKYDILKSDSMIRNVTVYWYWRNLGVSNDNDFMFTEISATINGTISYYYPEPRFYDFLLAQSYTLDANVNFSDASSSTNGVGLMMRNGTQNDEYPIVYYRGDVNNNNVIFADFCWLIVRTTETGGVKLIYNGEVNSDGSCSNYSNVTANKTYDENSMNSVINKTTYVFNTNGDSPVYVGYMYNDTNKFYADGVLDVTGYKAHLVDDTIDSSTGRHVQNLKDSVVKGVIDDWYVENILGKPEESLLEDTVWCNDRSVTSNTYSIENHATNGDFSFAAETRLAEFVNVFPTLECTRDMDKFTVDSINGNGDLNYPIGMLTADEINLAGHIVEFTTETAMNYLSMSENYWSLSPTSFKKKSGMYQACENVSLFEDFVSSDYIAREAVRVSISLGLDAHVTSGNGTFETPYIVE